MPTVNYVRPDGSRLSFDVPSGTSVMRGAVDNNVTGIDAECGGCLSCATCHVYIDEAFAGRLAPPSADEEEMLAGVAAERRAGSRLSCQIQVSAALEGLVVRIPERQT
ncbi:MAG TPA: 2Fe-2S iron-sulfur cluster-binding protein [Burkholderiales bacterium]|nr:2Fe-2S iron-sulfur cluster-binding protein [Burkholderiales bacterium]